MSFSLKLLILRHLNTCNRYYPQCLNSWIKGLSIKLKGLVNEGVKGPKRMRKALGRYVRKKIFAEEQLLTATSSLFFPLKRDISNHMYLAAIKLRFSKIDQRNIQFNCHFRHKPDRRCISDNAVLKIRSANNNFGGISPETYKNHLKWRSKQNYYSEKVIKI